MAQILCADCAGALGCHAPLSLLAGEILGADGAGFCVGQAAQITHIHAQTVELTHTTSWEWLSMV